MDSRWFKEDRALPKHEQATAIETSTTALKNSTLMSRRLGDILKDMYEHTLRVDEDFEKPGWKERAIAMSSRRKTIREITKLLP